MFTTDRLILRAYEDTDRADLLRLFNDPLVQRGVTNDYIVPRGPRYASKLEEGVYNALLYVVITPKDSDSDVFVGQASIALGHAKNRNAIFGISLLPEFWGRGYATEVTQFLVRYAFRALGMHRVELSVWEGNGAAIAVYRKVGFVEEGRKRKTNWVDGHWEDLILMGILEDEWITSQ